jgi:ribosomal protein S18 acetylase RimI-like enzyme
VGAPKRFACWIFPAGTAAPCWGAITMAVVAGLRRQRVCAATMMNRRRCGIYCTTYGLIVILLLLLQSAGISGAHRAMPGAGFVPTASRHRPPSRRHRHFDLPRQCDQSGPSLSRKTLHRDNWKRWAAKQDDAAAAAAADDDKSTTGPCTVVVRDCSYADLHRVADIILSSFYDKSIKSPWRQLYRMGELNRIQQGFAYPAQRDKHRMLVAVAVVEAEPRAGVDEASASINGGGSAGGGSGHIIGFCDVDGRPPNRPTGFASNPRPYLSDLCTDPSFRRRGVAKALVEACETYCRNQLNEQLVYIRVESHNEAAILLYEGMGYRTVDDELEADPTATFAVLGRNDQQASASSDTIRLLRKDLRINAKEKTAVDQPHQFSIADQGL